MRALNPIPVAESRHSFWVGFTFFLQGWAVVFGLVLCSLPLIVYRSRGLAMVPVYSGSHVEGHVTLVYALIVASLVGLAFSCGLFFAAKRARRVMRDRQQRGGV
jgi:hypothetical protein